MVALRWKVMTGGQLHGQAEPSMVLFASLDRLFHALHFQSRNGVLLRNFSVLAVARVQRKPGELGTVFLI
jgi:hypothetical protein